MLRAPLAGKSPDDLGGSGVEDDDGVERVQRHEKIAGGERGRAARERAVEDLDGIGVEEVPFALHRGEDRGIVGPVKGREQGDLAGCLPVGTQQRHEVFEDRIVRVDRGDDPRLMGEDEDRPIPPDGEVVVRRVAEGPTESRLAVDAGDPDVLPHDEEVTARQQLRSPPVPVVAGSICPVFQVGPDRVGVERPPVMSGPCHVQQLRLRGVRGDGQIPAAIGARRIVHDHALLVRGRVVSLQVRELSQRADLLALGQPGLVAGLLHDAMRDRRRPGRAVHRPELPVREPAVLVGGEPVDDPGRKRRENRRAGEELLHRGRSSPGSARQRPRATARPAVRSAPARAPPSPPRGRRTRRRGRGGQSCTWRRRRSSQIPRKSSAMRRSEPRQKMSASSAACGASSARDRRSWSARESAALMAKSSAPISTARNSRACRFSSLGPCSSIRWKMVRASRRVVRST